MTKLAVVTGASRGVGRGVAIALSEAGYRVLATGRTIAEASLPQSIIRIACDHTDDDQTTKVFRQLASENAPLEILVNCAWGGYERMTEGNKFTWGLPFWQQPLHRWASMIDAGLRTAFVCSAHAATVMTSQRRGLIVNIGLLGRAKTSGQYDLRNSKSRNGQNVVRHGA